MGSGKSTVAKIFRFLGVPVFDADSEARQLLEYDEATRHAVVQLFGPLAYNPNGQPNRDFLGREAFRQPDKLEALNRIIHPKVAVLSELWHKGHTEAYTLHEAALLVESGNHLHYDALVVVEAPREVKIERVAARNGWSRRHIVGRLKAQMKQRDLLAFADFVIKNDGNTLVIPQVLRVHRQILARCGSVTGGSPF